MRFDAFAQVVDVLVDVLQLGDLHDLVDRLLDRRPGIVGDFPCVDDMTVERQMGDEVERGFLGVDMDVIVDLIGDFGHLGAGRDALVAHQQLGAIDVDDLIDPRRGAAEKALDDRADQRLVGGDQSVLAGLIDVENRAARFQHAKVVALDGQQRSGDDALVDDLHRDVLGSQHVGSIALERRDDLTRDCHCDASIVREKWADRPARTASSLSLRRPPPCGRV